MLPFTIGISQILVAAMGVVVGIIFGAIPGMTATMAGCGIPAADLCL